MRKILILAITVIAITVAISVLKDTIVKVSVEKGVGLVTGLRLNIGSFKVGLIKTIVGIKNLKLFNPPGYKDETMLEMPEIYVDYSLVSLMKGKIYLTELSIDLKQFVVVKNEKGNLNLDSLKVVQAQKGGAKPAQGKMPEIKIDKLELKIGKVIYKDYSRGGVPSVTEYNVNLNEKYSNITNPYSLVSLIVVKALTNTAIANLTNFDVQGLQGSISDTLGSTQKAATEAVSKAGEAVTQAAKNTGAVAQQTQEAVQKTAEAVKDIFSGTFGGKK